MATSIKIDPLFAIIVAINCNACLSVESFRGEHDPISYASDIDNSSYLPSGNLPDYKHATPVVPALGKASKNSIAKNMGGEISALNNGQVKGNYNEVELNNLLKEAESKYEECKSIRNEIASLAHTFYILKNTGFILTTLVGIYGVIDPTATLSLIGGLTSTTTTTTTYFDSQMQSYKKSVKLCNICLFRSNIWLRKIKYSQYEFENFDWGESDARRKIKSTTDLGNFDQDYHNCISAEI